MFIDPAPRLLLCKQHLSVSVLFRTPEAMSESIRLQLNHLLASADAEYAAGLSSGMGDDFAATRTAKDRHNIHIEQMANLTKTAVTTNSMEELKDQLHEYEQEREADIKLICESEDNPLLGVTDQLAQVHARANDIKLTTDIVGKQIERSSSQLIDKVNRYIQMKRTRVNVENSLSMVRLCLQALEHTNQVQELLKSNHGVAAVQNLHDLQSIELEDLKNTGMGSVISHSIRALTKEITTSVLIRLGGFIDSEPLRKHVSEVGNRAFSLMQKQREAWDSIVKQRKHLKPFRLNSPVELAYRRSHENFLTESHLKINLGLLYEAEMVFSKLGKIEELESYVESKLSRYSDSLSVSNLEKMIELLPDLVGFCLFDRTLSRYLPNVRSSKMVDDNWEKLAQNISGILGSSLSEIRDLNVFRHQMIMLTDVLQNFDFNVAIINDLFRNLVLRLSEQIVTQAKKEFVEHWNNGDQMQMVITTPQSYEYVMATIWYHPNDYDSTKGGNPGDEQLPRAMPFSEIYVVICKHLRALIDHGNSFLDQFQHDPGFVENTVAHTVDQVLLNPVHSTLSEVAKGHNRELIVQTYVNLQLFYLASCEIEKYLAKMRGATGRRGSVVLEAKEILEKASKDMETRIHVLLEETVREFFETSTFDWHSDEPAESPSANVLEMTAYLLTMANTILKRLPPDVRLLAYFNLTENIGEGMRNALYSATSGITSVALENFNTDLNFLETSISQLAMNSAPSDTLLEARQILDLLRSDDPMKEYNDPMVRNRKYSRLSVTHASQLIRKKKRLSEVNPQSPDMAGDTSPRQQHNGFLRYLSGEK